MTQVISQRAGYRPCRPSAAHWDISKVVPMKTQGEIEAAICEGMTSLPTGIHGPGTQGNPRPPDR